MKRIIKNNNVMKIFYLIFATVMLTGCSVISSALSEKDTENTWDTSDYVKIGDVLTVQKSDSRLTLLDNKDALASDGLFYCAWTIGNSEPYENSEGDTVDLYDAQLYLLLGEFVSSQKAQENMNDWLSSAKMNYELIKEDEITCNGQTYTLITYSYIKESNPYARGASAFGVYEGNAVCVELACRDNFTDDPESILTDFLDNCTYSSN
ncbi:MAG: hypothetical protein K2K21_00905 [Lachnospiraceae bacterium]|nr:hypothetical protein [Lachnospiraceae bacterium]